MAKQREPEQLIMFPHNPEIRALSVIDIKLKGGVVECSLIGSTEANDAAMLVPDRWAAAVAEWLVRLVDGDIHKADSMVSTAHGEFCQIANAREADGKIDYARMS
jgi:hypothetical protein